MSNPNQRRSQHSTSEPSSIYKSLKNLYKVGLLTPKGALGAIKSIYTHGANLMVLLEFASLMAPDRLTLNRKYTYRQCYELAQVLAVYINKKYKMNGLNQASTLLSDNTHSAKSKPNVALLCSNNTSSILTLFAVARTGADITLLNTDMSLNQIKQIIKQQAYDLVICEDEFVNSFSDASGITPYNGNKPLIIYIKDINQIIESSLKSSDNCDGQTSYQASYHVKKSNHRLARHASGKINVLTGGTSGRIKFANRKPSPITMIIPFIALLNKAELANYPSVYIAVPFYHGYGLASLIIAVLLSARIFVSDKFDTVQASQLIEDHQIEVLILVPTMLSRLMNYDINVKDKSYGENKARGSVFNSVSRIISGGAPLNPNLVKQTLEYTGDTLFNLYGTSEAGFCVMATPTDLHQYPDSIGKAIKGVKLQILAHNAIDNADGLKVQKDTHSATHIEDDIGVLALSTAWSMDNKPAQPTLGSTSNPSRYNNYISTGDLAYANAEGYLFLKGRADNMIVSGGENVYPTDIERVIAQHPEVEQVAVIAIDNEEFGKRLVAFVSLKDCYSAKLNKGTPKYVKMDKAEVKLKRVEEREDRETRRLSEIQMLEWLKPKLARYQMPKQIILIDSMPLTKTGKVSQAKLKEWHLKYT